MGPAARGPTQAHKAGRIGPGYLPRWELIGVRGSHCKLFADGSSVEPHAKPGWDPTRGRKKGSTGAHLHGPRINLFAWYVNVHGICAHIATACRHTICRMDGDIIKPLISLHNND